MPKKSVKSADFQSVSKGPQISKSPHPHERDDTKSNFGFLAVCALAIVIGITNTPAYLARFWHVILFYTIVVWIIHRYRHNLDWQGRFLGLYRTKIGLNLMEKWGKPTKHEGVGKFLLHLAFPFLTLSFWGYLLFFLIEVDLSQSATQLLLITLGASTLLYCIGLLFRPIKTAGYHAIITGFIGMTVMAGTIGKAIFEFLFRPEAQPAITPVIPGLPIIGLGITLPLIIGWIALFLVIVVHEFSHGVVARAHKVKVESSGLFFMGPIGGAFVEPNEKQLRKEKKSVQLSIFAAGPFSNVILAGLLTLILATIMLPLANSMVGQGIIFDKVTPDFPAANAGITTNKAYTHLNGEPIGQEYICSPEYEDCIPYDFFVAMADIKAGDTVVFTDLAGEDIVLEAAPHPNNATNGYIGVETGTLLKTPSLKVPYIVLWQIILLTFWSYILSLGIGLANLLPIVITDGGRMFQIATNYFFGKEKGNLIWSKAGGLLFFLIAALLLGTIIKYAILPYL